MSWGLICKSYKLAVAITTSDDDDDDDDGDNGNANIEWAKESEMTNLQNSFYKLEIPRN